MSGYSTPTFAIDPSLLEQVTASTSTIPLVQQAQEALTHVSELVDLEVTLAETAAPVSEMEVLPTTEEVKEGVLEEVGDLAYQAAVLDDQGELEEVPEEDEGGYSPSRPQGMELEMDYDALEEEPSDPYVDAPTLQHGDTHSAPAQDQDVSISSGHYSPSAPQGVSLPGLDTHPSPSASTSLLPFLPTTSTSDAKGESDAEAEGEIDMDLAGGDEDADGEEEEHTTGTGVGNGTEMVMDPSLLGLSGAGIQSVPNASVQGGDVPHPGPSASTASGIQPPRHARSSRASPAIDVDQDPEPVNQTFRRPPNARRQSPTYTMPTPDEASKVGSGSTIPPPPPGAKIPARPAANTFSTSGQGRPVGQSPLKQGISQGQRQDYQQKFDFEGLEFPEGLGAGCGSVRRHPVLVNGWAQAKAKGHAAAVAHSLHALFEAARNDGDVEEARAWFAEFEKGNPTATGPLLQLINLELSHGNFIQVVGLYEKALRGLGGSVGAVPGVGIWISYLHYIRRQNPIPAPTPSNAATAEVVRQTVKSAYELALKECGNDISAGEIWQEYIAFLGEKENTNAWEIQQQVDAIRKVFQRAVIIPMYDVEAIWREYDAFENKQNKLTAKRFLADRSPLYMTARTALRDLRGHLENLVPLDVPPRPTWTQSDRDLVIAWRKYLKWEESNPLDIDDPSALQSRVLYAMKKCLTQMRFFPELWYHTSSYAQTQTKPEEAAAYLKNGLEANPTSFLLTFAYAEYEEGQKNSAVVRTTFESLIKHHGEQIEKLKVSIAEEAEAAKGPEADGGILAKAEPDDVDMEGSAPSLARKLYLEREAKGAAVTERRAKELDEMLSAAGVVWIMYMRFARRAEGLKVARTVFTQARKSNYVSWQVFEASAYMEYHCNKDASVATKIFELGLKAFPDEVNFAVKCLQFQLQINDDSNARALFERLALKFPADKARPIWDTWARYEYLYSDLSACQKLEARFAEAYPSDAPLKRFAARYNYLGLDEIAIRDLGFGLRPQAAPAPAINKRPLPEDSPNRSPRLEPRFRDDRGPPMRNEPPPKRARPISRDREPMRRPGPPPMDNGYYGAGRREASPPPRRMPERAAPLPIAPPMPVSEPLDRSGLPMSIARFLGNLPSTRTFDGPIFRADDLMNVLREARMPGPARPEDSRGPTVHASRGRI